jgi:arylsulfatase A-like enzyme
VNELRKKPNIILITTDQQRADSLGCYGNPVVRTPHIDQLADQGMRMERAYTNHPVCMPSRATLMTGRYPRSHGVTTNGIPLPREERTLAHRLADVGYRTALLGKCHLEPTHGGEGIFTESRRADTLENKQFFQSWQGPHYGFEHVQLSIGHNVLGDFGHYRKWLRERYPNAEKHYQHPQKHALTPPSGAPLGSLKWGLPVEAHPSVWLGETTCDYLQQCVEEAPDIPFFAWVNFQDPHSPMACPAPYCNMYDPAQVPMPISPPSSWEGLPPHHEAKHKGGLQTFPLHAGKFPFPGGAGNVDASKVSETHTREVIAHYYGMVSLIDDQVGRILDKLAELNVEEDTIVIFTSDHGELLGDHGLWLKGPHHYEGVIRVPMIWRYPGKIPAGQSRQALFSHIDMVPTLLNWTKMEEQSSSDLHHTEGIQGISQMAVLTGEAESKRENALCEYRVHPHEKAIHAKTLIKQRYKLTYYAGHPFGELYDLQVDPREEWNLWNDESFEDLKNELLQELLDLLIRTEDPLPQQNCVH